MTDVCDRAAEREAQHRSDALAAHKRCMATTGRMTEGAPGYCRVCGEMIPMARRGAIPGVATCVDCQQMLESARERGLQP